MSRKLPGSAIVTGSIVVSGNGLTVSNATAANNNVNICFYSEYII